MTNNDYTKAEFISWLGINGLDTKSELSIADAIKTQIKSQWTSICFSRVTSMFLVAPKTTW